MRQLTSLLYGPRYLVLTNTCTGALMFGVGDLFVQTVLEKRDGGARIDRVRLCKACVAGGYVGWVGHFWYRLLDRRWPGFAPRQLVRKLTFDGIIGPPFAVSLFFVYGKLNGKDNEQIWRDAKHNLPMVMLADWCFYIPLQYLNFRYFRPQFRVLYVTIISLFYDTFLVYLLNREHHHPRRIRAD